MTIDIEEIYKTTLERYRIARQNLDAQKSFLEHRAGPISDVIPGYSADELQFGSYAKENYAVLFVDMKKSTSRAHTVGAEITFLTMHVYLSALLEVVKRRGGRVIDIMGDGLMVFWGGEAARSKKGEHKGIAAQNAGLCGLDMLAVNDKVINRIISEEHLGKKVSIGVGATYGSVIVTKIGINDIYDVKAFGNCVNDASHFADGAFNEVWASKDVTELWPSSKGGKIFFNPARGGDAFVLQSH